MKRYETPEVEFIELAADIVTTSPTVPDFEEDKGDFELGIQDW